MRKKQQMIWDSLSLGVCYYPEQWDESLWKSDLERMMACGISTVRIGEFGWSTVEPREGEFTFDFYDRFLALVEQTPLKVIFGTPTATPPAWLTEKYPEVLNCRQDGVPYQHGMRRHYTYNSLVYQKLCARIVHQLGQHFGKHPSIVGWQIDNELNCETADFYSESDDEAFREFVRGKYGEIDALNKAWGTVFWNQTYTCWDEVHLPRLTIHNSPNPHHALDYIRFVSDSASRFCKMQSDILRQYCKPGDFITTNGLFPHLDNHTLTDEALDVWTYDSYPNFAFCLCEDPKHARNLNDRRWSGHLAEIRSISPHFGVMEQQSGATGWNTRLESPAPKPGQMLLWAMQSIAHGADFVCFFRWRTSVMGSEMYWHGILDYDNRDNRKIQELKELNRRLEPLRELAGADYPAGFALVRDYDNVWDSEVDRWHRRLAWSSEEEIFIASQVNHTPMDYLYLLENTEVEELLRYPILIYPHPYILTQRTVELLTAYVERGGMLILGARAGMKDKTGKCVMRPMPGLLSELTHTQVEEFTLVGSGDDPVAMDWDGKQVDTGVFNEVLSSTAEDARVLAVYSSSYYAGRPALIERTFGRGRVLHFGGTFTQKNTVSLLSYLGSLSPWEKTLHLPEECELCPREKDGKQYLFVLNYSAKAQNITLKVPVKDMESGLEIQGETALVPYEVKVYQIK